MFGGLGGLFGGTSALIRLDEGPQMMSSIIGCEPERVAIGMPVAVVFEDWTPEISIPKFRPAGDP